MDEQRTHYQVSFTPGQGLAVFLVLLGSIAGAYFFGLMTGLAGRTGEAVENASAAATPAIGPEDAFPTPVLGIQPGTGRAAAPPPPAVDAGSAPPAKIQLFEDRGQGDQAAPPTAGSGASAASSDGGFWVQVVSLSSEREARSRTARLVQRGYAAVVLPGPDAGKGTVYRVRVGPFVRREDAARAAARLSAEEKTETWIVPSGR